MKKVILLTFVLSIIACNQQNKKPEKIPKKIASMKIERFSVKNANADSTELSSYIIKDFDTTGTETKSVYYSAKGKIMMQFVNTYENGNKTKVNWINSKDTLVRYVLMSYDEDNRIIQSKSFNAKGEFKEGYKHQWKDNGKIEEKGPINEDGTFKPNSIYTYNDQQEFISLVEYDEKDSLYGTFNWKYIDFDEENEWTKRHMLFNDTLRRIETRTIKYATKMK